VLLARLLFRPPCSPLATPLHLPPTYPRHPTSPDRVSPLEQSTTELPFTPLRRCCPCSGSLRMVLLRLFILRRLLASPLVVCRILLLFSKDCHVPLPTRVQKESPSYYPRLPPRYVYIMCNKLLLLVVRLACLVLGARRHKAGWLVGRSLSPRLAVRCAAEEV